MFPERQEFNCTMTPFKNTLLKGLTPEIIARLDLRPVVFELEHEIEFPRADQLRDVGDIHIKERLEDLPDQLVRAHEQDDLPLRPVANLVYLIENHLDKDQLAHKPKRFHDHPEKKI